MNIPQMDVPEAGVRLPGWLFGLGSIVAICFSGVVWSYSTFVTIRERDTTRGSLEKRLDRIEDKLDHLVESLEHRR